MWGQGPRWQDFGGNMESQNTSQSEKTVFGVNRSIFLLGIVSFLTDLSSEMIFSVFSIFLTVILGASVAFLGIIEEIGIGHVIRETIMIDS